MRVAYVFTTDDYHELNAVARKNKPSSLLAAHRRALILWVIIFTALACLVLLIKTDAGKKSVSSIFVPPFRPVVLIGSFCGSLALVFVTKRLTRKSRALQSLKRMRILDVLITIEFDDDGLISSANSAETKWKWSGFDRVIETESRFFLRVNDSSLYVMIPKRELGSPSDINTARSVLENNVDRKTSAFPVIPAAPAK